jgi:Predicted Zn-dependent protease (DUF2268)
MKPKSIIVILLIVQIKVFSQQAIERVRFITTDIDNFWNAYDSVVSTTDESKKLLFLQNLYFDRATIGLKYFINNDDLTPQYMEEVLEKYPHFWSSNRANTLKVNSFENSFAKIQSNFYKIYPKRFKACNAYFLIGGLKKGGIINKNDILIASEVATTNKATNLSELSQNKRERMLLNKDLLFILTHEYVHLQQNKALSDSTINVLTFSLKEGSANFIASLITRQNIPASYMGYGNSNEKKIWFVFKEEMYSNELNQWIWGMHHHLNVEYLGYFVGYAICKSYYDNAIDKKKAIREIIELNYSDLKQINTFLKKSKYAKKWNK